MRVVKLNVVHFFMGVLILLDASLVRCPCCTCVILC